MTEFVYSAAGHPVGFVHEKFIHTLAGKAVGQIDGTHVHAMGGAYVGELDDGMVLDKHLGNLGNIGQRGMPGNPGSIAPPGSRAASAHGYPDMFAKLLA